MSTPTATPFDYLERVYAGVLGKIIGVYLGRPFEGWTFERIMAELGEIDYYVHERLGKPLVVSDDDISGTFTFLRALPDHGNRRDLSPAKIGHTWLNYIIEGRTILWWGGMGNSTEHTAYLRLKSGIEAPRSGSAALNGATVAEQIGAEIFIDGWGMVAPGDPELAADLAHRAASVSHDGEAIYGAQVIAAMEAAAFVESDTNRLLDTALTLIPHDATLYRMIQDVRDWHATESDWRATRQKIAAIYGYDRYPGNVHIIPNHALIILGLLYGEGDFQRSLMITNTAGWDTDCNSGNLGCLLGIRNGLSAFDNGPDWRGPVADRLYLPTADGGRAISDAVRESYAIANVGRSLAGQEPLVAKGGARFHFELPGSLQGFQVLTGAGRLENVADHSANGTRSLAIRWPAMEAGEPIRAATATFIPPEAIDLPGYGLVACPTLYPGQTIRAHLAADGRNGGEVEAALFLNIYGAADQLETVEGPRATLAPGTTHSLEWRAPDTGGRPIVHVGLAVQPTVGQAGAVYLDSLTWDGAPNVTLGRPEEGGAMWRRAWVDAVDQWPGAPEAYRLIQNRGTGLLIQGERAWQDYEVAATLSATLAEAIGIAARIQGLRRYYALLLGRDGRARLIKMRDGDTTLDSAPFSWQLNQLYHFRLRVVGPRIQGWIDDQSLFDLLDHDAPLDGGAIALICREGCLSCDVVQVRPTGA